MTQTAPRPLKGRHVLAIVLLAFGTIIAVNLLLAFKAVQTFPGLEVQNSYVAGVGFNDRRNAQDALGWSMSHSYTPGEMVIRVTDATGAPVEVHDLEVLIGRVTIARDDVKPTFAFKDGAYHAEVTLGTGEWMYKLSGKAADGTSFERREDFIVRVGS